MKFVTEVNIPESDWKVDYQTAVMFMGSCFTENIGEKMQEMRFPVDINPNGIVYNPLSISNSLRLLLQNKPLTKEDLFFDKGLWNSFAHHSRFSGVDDKKVLEEINSRLEASSSFLKNCQFLIITFGTAWVYKLKATGQVVANCHKVDAREFVRQRLTPEEIVSDYRLLIKDLLEFNPNLKIVFTVSPIRHWKDGAVDNQLSKATLLLAIDRLQQTYESNCTYFPSYEIVMDELRDYRYYSSDMLHLTEVAIEYIWSKFQQAYFSLQTIKLSEEVLKISKAMQHRAFNQASPEYTKFLQATLHAIDSLIIKYPFLHLEKEKEYFVQKQNQLK